MNIISAKAQKSSGMCACGQVGENDPLFAGFKPDYGQKNGTKWQFLVRFAILSSIR
jgi:hypothetical protein